MTGNSLLCEGSFAAWVPSGAVAVGQEGVVVAVEVLVEVG